MGVYDIDDSVTTLPALPCSGRISLRVLSFTVGVPGDPIAAHVGSTVILPCWISPPENAEALEIRWYRRDQFRNPVLLYNHGKIQDVQEETYRNRTSLALRSDQSGGLKDGDVSLRLDKLRVQDDGSFRCYVSGESSYGSEELSTTRSACSLARGFCVQLLRELDALCIHCLFLVRDKHELNVLILRGMS
uniref:Ig-like domain-containing protein n=1 Tax=Sinocyclocheilus grahami TaxID=75366 RepID=A0A672K6K8_SINGR